MKHAVEFKGFEPPERLRKLVERLVSRLDKKTKSLRQDPLFLRFAMEEIPPHTLYKISLIFDVAGKTLAAKQETHDAEAGIRHSFVDIERQIDSYKANLRGEQWWKRLSKREELQRQDLELSAWAQDRDEAFFTFVTPHVERLSHFVRHLIAYAEAREDLVRGELAPEDVTDAVLIRAYNEFVKEPVRGNIRRWLLRLAFKEVQAAILRSKAERRRLVPVEKHVPKTPPAEEVSTLGEEILDFYQPDEILKLEDVVPDLEVPTPEEETELEELRRCVKSALNTMPVEWRQVLMLHDVENLESPEVAKKIGKSEPEVTRILEDARQYLRQKLTEAGCTFKGSAKDASLPARTG